MHILYIPSYYPSKRAPITGIFFHDQVQAMHKAGHQVGVLTAPRLDVTLDILRESGLCALEATTRDRYFEDFPVYRMNWGWFPRVLPPLAALFATTAGFRAFEQYCQTHGVPDVVHGFNVFYGGYLTARLTEKYSVPAVLTEVSSSYLEGLVVFPGQPGIIRHTLRAVNTRLVSGRSLVGPVGQYAPEQEIGVLGCIIDTDFFTPDDAILPDEPVIFTVIAQLKEHRKGFDVLLKAFHSAFAGKNAKLLIRGHGPLRAELDKQIAKLGLDSQIEFLEYMNREGLRDLIRRSHAIVSSSYVETFAVSVAEALACGKPVVATRSGGPEDYVTEHSGILVPPGDVEALASGMHQVVRDYDRWIPEIIRADCVEHFGTQRIVQRLEAVYQNLLGNRR